MKFEPWHLWVIATIVFVLLEIALPSFVMMSIAMGCFLAFGGALFHAPLALQLILFCIGTIAGFLGVRPVMVKYVYKHKNIQTNASALVGRVGKVVEEINPERETGCVAIDGDKWKAISATREIIPAAEKVKVTALNSIIVTVEPLEPAQKEIAVAVETEITPKKRIVVRAGNKTTFIGYDDVLYIYSKDKTTFIVARSGKEHIHDDSLDRLEGLLPGNLFFRANRQFILSKNIVSEIKPVDYGKVEVILKPAEGSATSISVSRLKAHTFREWLK
jgi:membrane protein implicated in regulation of membrane protease activity